MKQHLLLFILLLCSVLSYGQADPPYPPAPAAPQQITAAEYFIDNDPGVGKATAISVTPGTDINITANSVNLSGITNGFHYIGLRTRNAEGKWSATVLKSFIINFDPDYDAVAPAQNIIAAEYFIDNDPGFGNGQPITITPGINVIDATAMVNVTGLPLGVHKLYIRTKDNEGKWSLTNIQDFIIDADPDYPIIAPPQNIVSAEYFIDTDPGHGNGHPITITPDVNLMNITQDIDVSGLPLGVHKLYIRTRNSEGNWSLTNTQDFAIDADPAYPTVTPPQNIVSAEYFIDIDPGHGNGHPISLTPGTDISNITLSADISGLTDGVHQFYLRTRSEEGKWSLSTIQDFTVSGDPSYPPLPATPGNIIAAEYFIDNDPGPGMGTAIAISPATDLQNISFSVSTTGLSKGSHTLYLRTKSQEGRWSFSNASTFFTNELSIQPDTLDFASVPTGISFGKDIVIKNNSSVTQTISSINIGTDFSTDAVTPIQINPGETDSLTVKFTPTTTDDYLDSIVLNTGSGSYSVILTGKGVNPTFSWLITPTSGHNFGSVQLNNSSSFNFTISNTSNVAVTLSSVVSGNSAFTAQYTPNTVIAANGSLTLPITFMPVTAGQYSTNIKILSSTPGVDSAVVNVYGIGYAPGTPPVLEFVNEPGYAGTSGVNPGVGQPGIFTYKILYKSADNKAPLAGYPRVSIDLDGNHSFADADEGTFPMVKESPGNDYVTGVVYSYSFNHNSNTNTAGYQFDAFDSDGNPATSGTGYVAGPVVSDNTPDLRIFANDISFSDNNPQPGTSFTMTATISNSANVPVTNIPIKIYEDTILIGSTTLSSVPANGSNSFNYNLSFAQEGFYPIKVWVDSSNTLGDNNVLNNYAIRPVIVGSPALPGGIEVTTQARRQECPELSVAIYGNAKYFGTGTNDKVAGAEVTINTGSQTFKTTTDANGNYVLVINGVTCGAGNFAYAVTVTDFTFTSTPVSNSISMPCPAPNACVPPTPTPPPPPPVKIVPGGGNCGLMAGGNGSLDLTIKVRSRDINNMWSGWDEVMKNAKLRVFVDGVLLEEKTFYQLFPGQEVTIIQPWKIPQSTNPINIYVEFVYTYVEYEWIPNTADVRPHYITYNVTKNITVTPKDNLPDLMLLNLHKKNNTTYQILDVNSGCGHAGQHVVRIYDGANILKTVAVNSLSAGGTTPVQFDISSLSPGAHTITIVTDDDNEVLEINKSNNNFSFSLFIPYPDLFVTYVHTSPAVPVAGTNLSFGAYIKNTGKATGNFDVKFSVDGTQIGGIKTVSGVRENDSVLVVSDPYIATAGANACGGTLEIVADAGNTITESDETNNTWSSVISADLAPYQKSTETGSQSRPAKVRVNNTGNFTPAIRNLGITDAQNVTVHYLLNGVEIGSETIASVKAGEKYAAHGRFSYMFSTAGAYAIRVVADSSNVICESDESNNAGYYYIEVTDSKPDLEVLSQYISPSSLNPNAGQNITIVGTVRNAGGKVTTPNIMRFFVDDVQLGDDVPFNGIEPGKDTTVAATVTYSSDSEGIRTMKIQVDPLNTLNEERENNNIATRQLIVGAAPDMLGFGTHPIKFNPSGFNIMDSVMVSYSITNGGFVEGSAWVRFMIFDNHGGLHAIDSLPFTNLVPGNHITLSKMMYFDIIKGMVVTQIVNCTPDEYNLFNNSDTLEFSTIKRVKKKMTINGNLDMHMGLPDDVPGWIGGKLILDEFDLTVNGVILNADEDHFIITNGTGKLILANNNTENTFPIGTDSAHTNFVKVANSGTPDIFSARVVPYVLAKGYSGDTLRTGNVNRTWFIDEATPGGSNATITFFWKEQDEQVNFDRSKSIVAHYTTGWQLGNELAANSLPGGEYSTFQTGISGFSPFTITNINSPLPLDLIRFEATVQDNDAILNWTSENEINVKQFNIEFSEDGLAFRPIGSVAALNQPGPNHYRYVHEKLARGTYYYRLQIRDIDGSYKYSVVRKINITKDQPVGVYPNPARSTIMVTGLSGKSNIKLIDMGGRILISIITQNPTEKLNIGGLTHGVYNLVIVSEKGGIITKRVVKQ